MSHPGLAGQQFGAHGFFATSDEVARTTWIASSGESGRLIFPWFAAFFPYARTMAITPPTVGEDSDVVPPCVAALNMLCVPHDVYPARERYVVVSWFWRAAELGAMSNPCVFATSPLPGSTCCQNIPPWWSIESKSLDDSAMTVPLSQTRSTAWRMNDE